LQSDIKDKKSEDVSTYVTVFMTDLIKKYGVQEADIEESSLENILNIIKLEIPDVQLFEDVENQRKQMKLFNSEKVKLPYYKGRLEMVFATLNEDLWTEDMKEYVEEVTKRKYIDIHMKVSGTGKTAKLFAVGTRIHLIYITAMSAEGLQPDFPDSCYLDFFHNLMQIASRGNGYLILNVRKEVLILLLSRILHLCKLVQLFHESLTPLQFLYHQFNGGMAIIAQLYMLVRSKCYGYSIKTLRHLIAQGLNLLINNKKIEVGLALDEASIAAKQFKNELISIYGKKRPLLTILVEEIVKLSSYIRYIAFSGTALTLHKIGTIYSTVGKMEMSRIYINGFPVESSDFSQVHFKNTSSNLDTIEKVENFVRMHINIDGCDNDSLQQLSKLRGRRRNSANLIKFISQNSENHKEKSQILKDCIDEAYNNTVLSLKGNILDKISNDPEIEKVVKEIIIYSTMFQNEGTVFADIVDILELGICDLESLKQVRKVEAHPNYNITNNSKRKRIENNIEITYHTISEPAVFDACLQIAKDMGWNQQSLIFAETIKLFRCSIYSQGFSEKSSEKGKLFEKLCFANIIRDYGDKIIKVSKLPFFPLGKRDIDIIFEDIDFKVINFGTTEELFRVSFDEYLAKVALLYKEKDKELEQWIYYIIMPPNEAHPDGLWITHYKDKLYFIVWSCKCYTSKLNIKESHCSTLIDRLFMNNYLEDKPDYSLRRELFAADYLGKVIDNNRISRQKCIKKRDTIIGGVLRVHVHAAKEIKGITNNEIPVKLLEDVTIPPMFSVDIGLENLQNIISDNPSLEIVKQCVFKGKTIDIE
jgi:hypothetical protein